MNQFFIFVAKYIEEIGKLFHFYKFDIGGIQVSLLQLLIGIICLSFVISIFWKGARA